MIKAILWDNDGVLVDTEKLFFQATKETLGSVGINLSRDLFIEFSLIRGNGLADYLKTGGVETDEWEILRDKRNKRYSELLKDKPTLIAGAAETLEKLHGQYRMGVVTSSRRDHFNIIHRSTEIVKFFDFVLTCDDYQNTKPNPEPYLMGLKRAGVRKKECLVVEDSARGLTSANRAGIQSLMIPNDMSRPETYKGSYTLLNSIRDVPLAIDDMNQKLAGMNRNQGSR